MTLNRAEDYYEKGKERLREQAGDKYRNLSEEKKKKKKRMWNKQILKYVWKKKKIKRISKKIIVRLKNLNIIMNEIVF